MHAQPDPRDHVVALIVSGPSGHYDMRLPLESTDPQYAALMRAQLPFEDGYEDGYEVGFEFADGSVSFSD